ncbi:MAG: GAF domain-containing protein [Chloroflexi bacterium]|nr:GAF domain-containing protein [Chloroflexota bacterium]
MSMPAVPPDPESRDPEAVPPVPPADTEAFADLAFDEEPASGPSDAAEARASGRPRRRFRRRLVLRLVALLLVSILLPLTIEGIWFYYRSYEEAVQLNLRREELVLDSAFMEFNEWMVQRSARMDVALNTQDVQEALHTLWTASTQSRRFANARLTLFDRLFERSRIEVGAPLYIDFALVTPDRRVLVATQTDWEGRSLDQVPFGPSLAAHWETLQARKAQHWVYPVPQTRPTDDALAVASAYPLYDAQGRFRGVLVGISSDLMIQKTLVRMTRWLPQGRAAFATSDGTVYTWDASMQTLRPTPWPQLSHVVASLRSKPQHTVLLGRYRGLYALLARWGLGPVQRLVPYTHTDVQTSFPLWWVDLPGIVGLAGWVDPLEAALVVTMPEQAAVAGVLELLRLRLLVWAALLALTLGVAVLFGRRLLRQVQDLVSVAEAFAQGRWDRRAEVVGNDEMALLAYTFNDLADQLQETYATMERELNLRTQQVQLVVTMATVALERGPDASQVLQTILQRMSERFPRFAYLSLRLWHAPDQGWQPAGRVSRLPQAVNLALRSFEPHLASEVGRALDMRMWSNQEGQSLRLPPPLTWMVGVPLTTPRRLLGVLFVGGVDPTLPGEYDRFALRLLARQLSLVLEYVHLQRGQALEAEKQRVMSCLLQRLPTLSHSSYLIPALVECLTKAQAEGILLVPVPELTDVWSVAYPQQEQEQTTPSVRNLLSLVSEGPTHLVVEEGEGLGIAALARRYNWQTLGLYPVRDPQGRLFAVWARGTRSGESEMPLDRAREQLFTELVGWAFLYVDMQQRLSVWEVVQKILEYAPEAPSEGHLYLRAWDLLQKHLPEADFFVASYRGGNPAYTFVYPYGQRYYHTTVTPAEQALIQQVAERGQPLLLSDKHKVIAQIGKAVRVATRIPESWLGVPVVLGRQRLGVIGLVQWERPRAFSEEHRSYLFTLSQGLAGVMYAIQQEGRLRRRIEREQSLRTFAQRLAGLTDVRNMLEFSAAEIQRLFEAYQVEIELFSATEPAPSDGDASQEQEE